MELYNDLDFIVDNKLMILVETQSTWHQPQLFNEQPKQHGMTQKAVTETIHICKDRNVLGEYLLDREKAVVTVMMSLFDEEQIMKSFIKSERHDADVETAKRLLKMGKLSFEEIASGTGLTVEEVDKLNRRLCS